MTRLLTRFVLGIGFLVAIVAGLTACSAPLNAPSPAVPGTATRAPSRAGRREEPGTPITAATPVLAVGCDAYATWLNDPEIQAALKNTAVWPELTAAGNTAAGGGAVDRGRMKQIDHQIGKSASSIRGSSAAAGDQPLTQTASRAMGLAARFSAGLADGSLDQKAAGDDVARLKAAIAVYESEAAAQQARCS